MKIHRDYLLVKPDQPFTKATIAGVEIKLADSFTQERRINVFGKVIMLPDKIYDYKPQQEYLKNKLKDRYSNWKWRDNNTIMVERYTDIRIKVLVGDRVMFSHQFLLDPEKHTIIKHKGDICFLIRYDYIYAIEKGDELKTLHNFLMIESVYRHGVKLDNVGKVVFGPREWLGKLVLHHVRAIRTEYSSHKKWGNDKEALKRLNIEDVICTVSTLKPYHLKKTNEIVIHINGHNIRIEDICNYWTYRELEKILSKDYKNDIVHIENNIYRTKDYKFIE